MRVTVIFLCLSVLLPVSAFALSAEDLIYITEEYPPYSYTENGKTTGFAVEVLRLMWTEMGVAPQPVEVQPWARGMYTLEHEPNIMLFGAGWSPEREAKFHFIKPLLFSESSIIARKSKKIAIASSKDILQYKVGSVRSDLSEQALLDTGVPVENLQRVPNINIGTRMLAHNRIDLMAGGTTIMFRTLAEEGFDPDDFEVVHVIARIQNGFMLSRDVPDALARQFQNALETVRKAPEFDVLVETYSLQRMNGSP